MRRLAATGEAVPDYSVEVEGDFLVVGCQRLNRAQRMKLHKILAEFEPEKCKPKLGEVYKISSHIYILASAGRGMVFINVDNGGFWSSLPVTEVIDSGEAVKVADDLRQYIRGNPL
jgi:hypothetical protein